MTRYEVINEDGKIYKSFISKNRAIKFANDLVDQKLIVLYIWKIVNDEYTDCHVIGQ